VSDHNSDHTVEVDRKALEALTDFANANLEVEPSHSAGNTLANAVVTAEDALQHPDCSECGETVPGRCDLSPPVCPDCRHAMNARGEQR